MRPHGTEARMDSGKAGIFNETPAFLCVRRTRGIEPREKIRELNCANQTVLQNGLRAGSQEAATRIDQPWKGEKTRWNRFVCARSIRSW